MLRLVIPLEVADVQKVKGEVQKLELMPLAQEMHHHRSGQTETISELNRVCYTRLKTNGSKKAVCQTTKQEDNNSDTRRKVRMSMTNARG